MNSNRLLFIEASPRGKASTTTRFAEIAIDALSRNRQLTVDGLNLWEEELPRVHGDAIDAKYAVVGGEALGARQEAAWRRFEAPIERFKRAGFVVLAAPMWNFSVPYVLKRYIDVITQPGLTFTWQPNVGYRSLLPQRPALLITSSGGDYSAGSGNEPDDFCLPYLQAWLEVYMGCAVSAVAVGPTVADARTVRQAGERAHADLQTVLKSWSSAG